MLFYYLNCYKYNTEYRKMLLIIIDINYNIINKTNLLTLYTKLVVKKVTVFTCNDFRTTKSTNVKSRLVQQ